MATMLSVGLLVLLPAPSLLRGAVAPTRRAPVPRACAADAPRWFVTVPRSLAGVSEQAARSVLGATQAGERRMVVEASLPELDPTSPAFRYMELLAFVEQLGLNLLNSGALPRSRPHVKLLFCGGADATLAGGAITYTNLPVSVLGAQTSMGEQDGAFIFVAPRGGGQGVGTAAGVEAAAAHVLAAAGNRPVVVVNPRLGGASTLESSCKPVYVVRPLTVSYLEDSTAPSLSRGGACLLRCFPHEWSVLADPFRTGDWSYVGRFDARPSPTQLEGMLVAGMTDLRNRRFRDNAAAAERERGGKAVAGGEGPAAP